MATLENVLKSIRELSFDRFVTPCFFISHRVPSADADSAATKWFFSIDALGINLIDKTAPLTPATETILFADYPTLDDIINKFIELALPLQVTYSGSFIPSEPSTSLLPVSETAFNELFHPVFRRQYFSDEYVTKKFEDYGKMVLHKSCTDVDAITDWAPEFSDAAFDCYRELHFTIWVAYQLVGDRRLYELAAQNLLQSSAFGNLLLGATSYISNSNFSMTGPGERIQVQIGDVFTLNEDQNTSLGIHNDGQIPEGMLPPWAVGSDNTLMDYYSFWYRLQMYLRDKLEQETGDYTLRKNQIMTGKIYLDPRDSHKWLSYFDSYPWVFSPYMRGIPNRDVQNLRT